ncbi:MAG: hypothetical protein Q4D21_06200 [Phascolarctobacterium sp.]|nr:hypothetical protein [Phascolarctobacterium sp.]
MEEWVLIIDDTMNDIPRPTLTPEQRRQYEEILKREKENLKDWYKKE